MGAICYSRSFFKSEYSKRVKSESEKEQIPNPAKTGEIWIVRESNLGSWEGVDEGEPEAEKNT